MKYLTKHSLITCLLALILLIKAGSLFSQQNVTEIPKLIKKDGFSLIVDGQPFFMLGGQAHNSSAWPDLLPQVWSTIKAMHANTLEIPIYWQQIEPQEGVFDFSVMDTIISQARQNKVRLVLLWFATWKNSNTDYTPDWVKLNPKKYPHMVNRDGQVVVSPSPYSKTFLNADTKAFTTVMKHLKEFDPQHTVIMMQVENEPGTYGTPRDFSPEAEKLFKSQVPAGLLNPEVLKALNKAVKTKGTWAEVFGNDADEFFHAWSVGSYINHVAEAGKAVYPLPMYVNVALEGEPGGAMPNVIPVWKVAAPAIDVLAPDIYQPEDKAMKYMEIYDRPDNALLVPETFPSVTYLYEVIRRGGIGFSPFGVDRGLPNAEANMVGAPLSKNYAMLRLADGKLATWIVEKRLFIVEPKEPDVDQTLDLGGWQATVSFSNRDRRGNPTPQPNVNGEQPKPNGRALIAKTGENEFVVMAHQCRIGFQVHGANKGKASQFLKVEEGYYENGEFKLVRLRNGDQVGWGATSIGEEPVVLRYTMTAW